MPTNAIFIPTPKLVLFTRLRYLHYSEITQYAQHKLFDHPSHLTELHRSLFPSKHKPKAVFHLHQFAVTASFCWLHQQSHLILKDKVSNSPSRSSSGDTMTQRRHSDFKRSLWLLKGQWADKATRLHCSQTAHNPNRAAETPTGVCLDE